MSLNSPSLMTGDAIFGADVLLRFFNADVFVVFICDGFIVKKCG
jgi:hypothetical protein